MFMLKLLLEEKNLSLYRLEKESHISHATISDLYNEKSDVRKCSAELIFKIANTLNMDMSELYSYLTYSNLNLIAYNRDFDLFKSNICQELKNIGDKEFLKKYLTNNYIDELYSNKKYCESLYLLSLVDYLCKENKLPVANKYRQLRRIKMNKLFVPESIYLLLKYNNIKITKVLKEAIPTFLEHNIVEAELSNVY